MKSLLTPKQVANAIAVSESSVKRWCDKGTIPTRYTAGGHRRIPLAELLDFVKASKHELVRPEVLGLPSNTGRSHRIVQRVAGALLESLLAGDEEQCRRIVLDLFLAEHSVAAIFDQTIAPTFEQIGHRWECGEAEVYQERRSCEIVLRLLHEIRSLLPGLAAEAPVAIGASPSGDQYNLAATMAELVLRDLRWNATCLGDNLPLVSMAEAIRQYQPRLFWLSVSHLNDPDQFIRNYSTLFEEFGMQVAFVVGGRALTEPVRKQMRYAAFCDNMRHLESFAQTLSPNHRG